MGDRFDTLYVALAAGLHDHWFGETVTVLSRAAGRRLTLRASVSQALDSQPDEMSILRSEEQIVVSVFRADTDVNGTTMAGFPSPHVGDTLWRAEDGTDDGWTLAQVEGHDATYWRLTFQRTRILRVGTGSVKT